MRHREQCQMMKDQKLKLADVAYAMQGIAQSSIEMAVQADTAAGATSEIDSVGCAEYDDSTAFQRT